MRRIRRSGALGETSREASLWFRVVLALAASLALPVFRPAPGAEAPRDAAAGKLNFVFILADDLGWTDLSSSGSDFYETPKIDRLAAEGVRFTDAYSACTVCSPTRASILTGKHPARLRLTDWIPGHWKPGTAPAGAELRVPEWTMRLAQEEVTLAEALRPRGYTSASIGKWHLGVGDENAPTAHGFDLNVAGYGAGQPPSYFHPYKRGGGRREGAEVGIPHLAPGRDGEYLTDRLTDEALRFIESSAGKPFFLYLPHYAVHTPLEARPELVRKYEEKARRLEGARHEHRNPVYAAMIESLDASVGRIVAKLEELGIAGRTAVFFTSDNGGLVRESTPYGRVTWNAPLRAGKGSAYEGGVRVPLIVRLPGAAPPDRVIREPVFSADFYPTILELAGVRPEAPPGPAGGGALDARGLDGVSLVPLLTGAGTLAREALYWHYPHYHPGGAGPYGAIRAGRHRLVELYEDRRVELYDLAADIGETRDLAALEVDVAADLRRRLDVWRRSVGAQMPVPPSPEGERAAGSPAPLERAHAHNDYRHARPLLDALARGFTSIEADVFLDGGKLLVGHDPGELSSERTLEALYLVPLRDLARKNGGRIHPGGRPLTLLIDIKSGAAETYRALEERLEEFRDILTSVDDGTLTQGAVDVVVSGNRPREIMAGERRRRAALDGRLSDLESDAAVHLMPLVSDNWRAHFTWRGEGPMPEAEKTKLREIAAKVHARGRRLRFWATPESPLVWRELLAAGVDLIGTDDLDGLSRFLTPGSRTP
jgi:arylsulfatase A-like enzyme